MSIHITDDEIDRKARELREKRTEAMRRGEAHLFDKNTIVNRDPSKSYRGVYIGRGDNKGRRIEEMKALGWEITNAKGATAWPIKMERDGGLVNGDVILMETAREVHIESLAKGRVKQMDMEGRQYEEFKDNINRTIRNEMGGKSHTDYVIDESKQGPEEVTLVTRAKK